MQPPVQADPRLSTVVELVCDLHMHPHHLFGTHTIPLLHMNSLPPRRLSLVVNFVVSCNHPIALTLGFQVHVHDPCAVHRVREVGTVQVIVGFPNLRRGDLPGLRWRPSRARRGRRSDIMPFGSSKGTRRICILHQSQCLRPPLPRRMSPYHTFRSASPSGLCSSERFLGLCT